MFASTARTSMDTLKREFHCKLKSLHTSTPDRFATSQWLHKKSHQAWVSLFLIYRWLLALFFTAAVIISIIEIRFLGKPGADERRAKWPIYLTNWAFVFMMANTVCSAALATKHHLKLGKPYEKMAAVHRIFWVINNISNAFALSVTFGYWAVIYNPELHRLDFVNISAHAMNSVFTLIDLFICAHPVRLLHLYQPGLIAAIYAAFTGIYYIAGGTNRDNNISIYPILDWAEHPLRSALVVLVSACVLIVLHVFIWVLYLIRRRIAHAIIPSDDNESVEPVATIA